MRRLVGRDSVEAVTCSTATAAMHILFPENPTQDFGFYRLSDGSLRAADQIGSQQPVAGCGFIRTAAGWLMPDSTPPTLGFFKNDGNGNWMPRGPGE